MNQNIYIGQLTIQLCCQVFQSDRTIEASKTTAFGRPDLPKNNSLSGGADGRSVVVGDKTVAIWINISKIQKQ